MTAVDVGSSRRPPARCCSGEWPPSTRPALLRRASAHPPPQPCGNPACGAEWGASTSGEREWQPLATEDDRRLPPGAATDKQFCWNHGNKCGRSDEQGKAMELICWDGGRRWRRSCNGGWW
ncbi:hypothetical protein VPH35_076482 [Triticum aestivum]|uniref:uncharacterized protein n=1 Tax=Triticum aestivum TaxID=4565 RepID=UPI00098A0D6B|nr:uncharacterized protein LOC109778841 [Aegilops tauschii subsp. strangulata]XP_044373365.1 uncharacterized protein LOC123095859 [Triticum aestivum]